MRVLRWSFLLFLASCGEAEPKEPLEILTGSPPLRRVRFDLGETNIRTPRFFKWNLLVTSNAKTPVQLQARLEEPVLAGSRVQLRRNRPILREGQAEIFLILWPPNVEGPYEGDITLFSDDLPGWSYQYRYTGSVVDRAPEGRRLEIRPAGKDLGDFKPGEVRDFLLTLASTGSETVIIRHWRADGARIRLQNAKEGEQIVPGAELQVNGAIKAPMQSGPFRESIGVVSNATINRTRTVWIAGRVVPPYGITPARLRVGAAYAALAPSYRARLEAAVDSAPFRVARVTGHETHFEVAGLGGEEAQTTQEVELRLRPDAPLGVSSFKVTFHLEPGGGTVLWPVDIRIVGAIQAVPEELNFGRIAPHQSPSKDVRLLAFADRRFDVLSVRSRNGYFVSQAKKGADGWRVAVRPVPNLRQNTPYRDQIEITTNDPDTPTLIVTAYVEVVP